VAGGVQGLITVIGTSIDEPLPKEEQASVALLGFPWNLDLTRIKVFPINALAGTTIEI
jgi:hypothetical protein